ncbi:MAG: NUDIX hydrolase [bacterium]|nr:NUDIX hydrolase [bacterium]
MNRVSDLRTHLEAYRSKRVEVEAVAATLNMLATVTNPLSDKNYIPGHVTASAFVIDKRHQRLVLIHHAKLERWLQPGGHIDPGEDSMTAALREVQEETGIVGVPLGSGIFDIDIHSIPAHGGRPSHLHYDVRFLVGATNETFSDSDEVLGVRWVAFNDVPQLTSEESVLRPTAKIKRLLVS